MKYIKYLTIVFIVISLIILILYVASDPARQNMSMVGVFLTWTYILMAIAAVAAIGMPLVYMIKNPEKLKKTGMYVGLMLIVLVISYLLASSEPLVGMTNTNLIPTPNALKWTDTGIIAMYILLICTFASILVGSIVNMIRNR
jgi:hypothetical protein